MKSLSCSLILVCLAVLGTIGCATDQCATCYEDPGVPQMHPLGAVTRAHFEAMEANGEAADFVLTSGEFEPNSSNLTAAGRDHIMEIGARMGGTPFPVLVEPSGSAGVIDDQRAQTVTSILTNLGNADASQRVMISRPYTDGMHADEAIRKRMQ